MKGKLYGIGVGPGDPELMTLKAVRIIGECPVAAAPGKDARSSAAYRIASGAVPGLDKKEIVSVPMPMVRDRDVTAKAHREAASLLRHYLDAGKDVAYLTLGDPTVYCTFSYIQELLEADGYETELVSGIPSFCAAAARLGRPLALGGEGIHVIPAPRFGDETLRENDTYVLMKAAGSMGEVKALLEGAPVSVCAAENCTMEDERLYRSAGEIPGDAGYFSIILAKCEAPRKKRQGT